jgi:hypothetical protein
MTHNDDNPAIPELTGLAPSRLLHVPAEDRITYLDVETVQDSVERVKMGLTTAAQELAWQLESQVWQVMHFEDWPTFQLAMYGKEFITLVKREERSWFVAELLQAGSTQAQAAKALGVSQATVNHDFQVIGSDNPEAAAAIEAKPHARSGQPKRHARKPKPAVAPVNHGEKGDRAVGLVKDQLSQEQAHLQRVHAALTYLPKLNQAQLEELLQSLEPLDEAVKDIRTKLVQAVIPVEPEVLG